MSDLKSTASFSRRRLLAMGGRFASGLLLTSSFAGAADAATHSDFDEASSFSHGDPAENKAIISTIETILDAQGKVSNGLFSVMIERKDITNVTLHGVPITPSFQINGGLFFQKEGPGRVFMNADLALKASEIDPIIDQFLLHEITIQAEHQHFYDFSPEVWYMHMRCAGTPAQVARGMKAALNVTSTPFPQTKPKNPTSPLPAAELGRILGGPHSIGSNGVVTVNVPRKNKMMLGGRRISPFLNIATPIVFQPHGGGENAAAVPDFGMVASEVQSVLGIMREQGWNIGCLYNQETDEQPQLYFSHQFKTGNAITLAHELRKGLDRMDMKFTS